MKTYQRLKATIVDLSEALDEAVAARRVEAPGVGKLDVMYTSATSIPEDEMLMREEQLLYEQFETGQAS